MLTHVIYIGIIVILAFLMFWYREQDKIATELLIKQADEVSMLRIELVVVHAFNALLLTKIVKLGKELAQMKSNVERKEV